MASFKFKNPETGEWDKLGIPMPGIPEGMQMELLWENASPTSSFAAQTINIERYDFYMVCQKSISNGSAHNYLFVSADGKNYAANISGSSYLGFRVANASDGKISFRVGRHVKTHGDGNDIVDDNSVAIPVSIYGIKGVSA